MIIKARPLALLLSVVGLTTVGCAISTTPGANDEMNNGTGSSTGVVNGTGGGTGVPGSGGALGASGGAVGATGGAVGATGGAVGATGGGGGVVTPTTPYPAAVTANTISTMGAIKSGAWEGYAYTWASGSAVVNPTAGAEFTDNNLCAWGSTIASDTSVFGLGFSVAQPPSTTVPGTWDISGSTGISYAVTNNGGTLLRIQLTVDAEDYCAEIAASGSLTWADFRTECWGTAGVALTSGQLESINVIAPGAMAMARAPAFCIGSIAPL